MIFKGENQTVDILFLFQGGDNYSWGENYAGSSGLNNLQSSLLNAQKKASPVSFVYFKNIAAEIQSTCNTI